MDKMKLKVSSGKTINLGNYESARIDVGIECMVDNKKVDIETAYDKMKAFVDGKVEEQVNEWQM